MHEATSDTLEKIRNLVGLGKALISSHGFDAGLPVHVVWGISKGRIEPAVLITAYRPDPGLWEDGFRARRSP